MPLIFGPTSRNDITTREAGHLRADQLSIDKQLHLNTLPRIRIAHHPPGNTLPPDDRLTPTMKRRRKGVQVNNNRNRPNENGFKYGFCNQEIDETGHKNYFGSAFGGNNHGHRDLNSVRTISSTSSAVAASRHLNATSIASSILICERTALTRGIIAGIILRSLVPNPASNTAYAGVDAISPHTITGIPSSNAAPNVRSIPKSTAGCSVRNQSATLSLPRSTASVYWTRSFVPNSKNTTSSAIFSAVIIADGTSIIAPTSTSAKVTFSVASRSVSSSITSRAARTSATSATIGITRLNRPAAAARKIARTCERRRLGD